MSSLDCWFRRHTQKNVSLGMIASVTGLDQKWQLSSAKRRMMANAFVGSFGPRTVEVPMPWRSCARPHREKKLRQDALSSVPVNMDAECDAVIVAGGVNGFVMNSHALQNGLDL